MKKTLLALATIIHLLPHPLAISPVGATALYAGAFGRRRWGWLVPLLPLTLGVAVTGFYSPIVMVFVFAGYAVAAVAGRLCLARRRSPTRYGAAVIAGALIFFVLSNFSVWLAGYYPPTPAGFVACYANGLPYLAAALAGDAAYCCLLFGLHATIERRETAPAVA